MKNGSQLLNWLLLIGLSLMWGFSFFFIKKGLEAFQPVEVGALRVFIAFCTLVPFLVFFHKKIPLKAMGYTALAGLLGSGLPPILFSFGQTHVSTSVAGILNTTTPLFALSFGVLLFGVQARWNQFVGVVIGFLGAVCIVLAKSDGDLAFEPGYAILIILATSCYGMSANVLKSKVMKYDIHPIQISILGFLFMGPIAAVFLAYNGTFSKICNDRTAQDAMRYLLVLGVFGTAIAMFFFNWLTKRTSALFASFTTYIIPLVAILIGVFVLREKLNFGQVAGFIIILTGVILANRKVSVKEKRTD